MKLQSTNIMPRENDLYAVEMLMADSPDPEPEDEQIYLVCHVQVKESGRYPSLAELQTSALIGVRDELVRQRDLISSAVRGQK